MLLFGPLSLAKTTVAVNLLLGGWSNFAPLAPPPRGTDYESPAAVVVGGFPTQYLGLRTYYHGAVQDLCLVAQADAPAGMGGVWKLSKNGTLYAVYLVETTDPNATPVRVKTTTGVKSVRIKT